MSEEPSQVAIPTDFRFIALSDISHIEMGQSPDSNYVSDDPYVGYAFLQGNAEFGVVSPTPKYSCIRPAKLAKKGDVLISVRAPVGAVNVADRDYCIGRGLAAVRAPEIAPSLLAYLLSREAPALRKVAQGTTFEAIGKSELHSLRLTMPPENELGLTSFILDTLDTAIRETEAIIAKLKAVKQGLLHDLLTRGIDANGELRPPQAEAPHLYKQSPLGWIPKEWEAVPIAHLLANVDPAMRSGPFGSALLKEELVSTGVPLLGIDNVHVETFSSDFRRFVSQKKFSALARYAVRPSDLMITIMGTIGRCCLVPNEIGLALSSKHTWTITLDNERYSPYLAMLQVNYSPWVLSHFAKDQQGGTMAAIRSDTLRSTLLPAPPRHEQGAMEDRLRTISKRIELEAESLAKQRLEKAALMNDLLTGHVRVSPLLIAEQRAQVGSA